MTNSTYSQASEIPLDASKDSLRLVGAEALDEPNERIVIPLTIIAPALTVTQWDYVRRHSSGIVRTRISKRHPVIHSDNAPVTFRSAAYGAAVVEITQTKNSVRFSKFIGQPLFLGSSIQAGDPLFARITFSPIREIRRVLLVPFTFAFILFVAVSLMVFTPPPAFCGNIYLVSCSPTGVASFSVVFAPLRYALIIFIGIFFVVLLGVFGRAAFTPMSKPIFTRLLLTKLTQAFNFTALGTTFCGRIGDSHWLTPVAQSSAVEAVRGLFTSPNYNIKWAVT